MSRHSLLVRMQTGTLRASSPTSRQIAYIHYSLPTMTQDTEGSTVSGSKAGKSLTDDQ